MCFEPFADGSDEVRLLPCGHLFHSQCVDEWLKRSRLCPSCNQDVLADSGPIQEGEVGVTPGGKAEEKEMEKEATSGSFAYGGSKVWTVVPHNQTAAASEADDLAEGPKQQEESSEQQVSSQVQDQDKEVKEEEATVPVEEQESSGSEPTMMPVAQLEIFVAGEVEAEAASVADETEDGRPATMTGIFIAVERSNSRAGTAPPDATAGTTAVTKPEGRLSDEAASEAAPTIAIPPYSPA